MNIHVHTLLLKKQYTIIQINGPDRQEGTRTFSNRLVKIQLLTLQSGNIHQDI
uniref:Uncharacterized protein n=1 Tax=Octopus bimaculoides TaxID=37653 RepID=A0A0L8GKA8_OCTBM